MDTNWLELFEEMSAGELSEEKKNEVLAKINNDPEVAELYEQFRAAKKFIELKIQFDNQNKIQEILTRVIDHEAISESGKKDSKTPLYWWYTSAAVLLTLVLLGFWQISQYTDIALSQAYLEIEKVTVDTPMGAINDSLQSLAVEAINEKNYTEAIPYLYQLMDSFPDDRAYRMTLGKVLVKAQKPTQAISVLEHEKMDFALVVHERNWFLALAYLQSGNSKMALEYCDRIIEGSKNLSERKKAASLKSKLNSWWR
ncbi:MAG: hypothetical protein KDE26_09685 [Bacteroidetes bacterium]|nr:hypothetical protein [Bacteroidota bacterium]